MLLTIETSSRVYVQGELAGCLEDGRLMVRDGEKLYFGQPVAAGGDQGVIPAALSQLRSFWPRRLCF
jgi:hypothetical protein